MRTKMNLMQERQELNLAIEFTKQTPGVKMIFLQMRHGNTEELTR
jgi:hypothetical protein